MIDHVQFIPEQIQQLWCQIWEFHQWIFYWQDINYTDNWLGISATSLKLTNAIIQKKSFKKSFMPFIMNTLFSHYHVDDINAIPTPVPWFVYLYLVCGDHYYCMTAQWLWQNYWLVNMGHLTVQSPRKCLCHRSSFWLGQVSPTGQRRQRLIDAECLPSKPSSLMSPRATRAAPNRAPFVRCGTVESLSRNQSLFPIWTKDYNVTTMTIQMLTATLTRL